ncbi:hypothetical protein PISMIDRAFT_676226, partial [Pisolithus microcarpus 441]
RGYPRDGCISQFLTSTRPTHKPIVDYSDTPIGDRVADTKYLFIESRANMGTFQEQPLGSGRSTYMFGAGIAEWTRARL